MSTQPPSTSSSLVRSTLQSLLWLFVVPLLSAWFFSHASARYDAPFLQRVERMVASGTLDAPAAGFWRQHPPSRVCSSSDPQLQQLARKVPCGDYAQFVWGRRVALGSIGLGLLGLLLIGVLLALSRLSPRAQVLSFRAGWNLLKLFSLAQVLAQGLLLVGLSYWVTALWLHVYVPKLILVVALLAMGAAFLVIKAIFRRIPLAAHPVAGRLLGEAEAPGLWRRVRDICAALDTAPPEQIVVGVEANVFVTEHRVALGQRELEGRTLFLSLPLLEALERGEADAVLAHEMAHFSGADTHVSRKLSPLLARYVHYLEALHEGGVSLPVFHFMLAYWTLFQLSLSRTSRQRELRADAIAAQQTSPDRLARALVKIAAYCAYRDQVEQQVLQQDALAPDLDVPAQMRQGFHGFAVSPALQQLLGDDPSEFGHPFDSHPPLSQRLTAVGSAIAPEAGAAIVTAEPRSSWLTDIHQVEQLARELWQEHRDELGRAQQMLLAYRLQPASAEEQAIVEQHFPSVTFAPSDGELAVAMSYRGVATCDAQTGESLREARFEQIATAQVEELRFKRYLRLQLHDGDSLRICLNQLEQRGEPLLGEFDRYYGRHLTAQQYLAQGAQQQLA